MVPQAAWANGAGPTAGEVITGKAMVHNGGRVVVGTRQKKPWVP